ncbi:MAG: SAM-dependent methyltransferase [Actinomadura sp.]
MAENPSPEIDTSVPHSARIWNYWLGGKDNYQIDREVGEQILEIVPGTRDTARHSRAFLGRVVRHLAGEAGIRQFLDIGTGLPTHDNTHEVAQRVAPDCRIVYVDNDPLVLVHAQALLTSTPEGACDYIEADVRDTGRILAGAAKTLDFGRPVGLMLLGIMMNVPDDDEACEIVRTLLAALPSGSHLALNDASSATYGKERSDGAINTWMERGGTPMKARTPEEIGRFFDGLEMLGPGVVSVSRWRAGPEPWAEADEVAAFCGLARKP